MNLVFADTYYYLALGSPRDAGHARAAAFSRAYRGQVFTTAAVLTEVADAFAAPDQRQAFVALRSNLRRDPHTTIVAPTAELFEDGCDLYAKRPDKEWSLTDCISFVVMERYGITDALTADHHFEQAGFVALLR
jgi:predicted nucleic acid-binding protein